MSSKRIVMREKRGSGGTRTPSMVAVIRCSGTPVSCACISISVTPHDETPARNASLLVKASGCGREDESRISAASRVALRARPMVLAHIAWDLAKASGGRFILGLGSQVKGHNERRFSVKWEAPAPRMREVVQALRAIWDCWQNGTKLAFKGQFYRFDLMTPFFNPGPIAEPKVPIYIAGVNYYMCRIAGEVCDGLHVHPFTSPKYLREAVHPAVEQGLKTSGRKR